MQDGSTATETVGTVNEMPATDTSVMAEAQAANLQAPDDGVIHEDQRQIISKLIDFPRKEKIMNKLKSSSITRKRKRRSIVFPFS